MTSRHILKASVCSRTRGRGAPEGPTWLWKTGGALPGSPGLWWWLLPVHFPASRRQWSASAQAPLEAWLPHRWLQVDSEPNCSVRVCAFFCSSQVSIWRTDLQFVSTHTLNCVSWMSLWSHPSEPTGGVQQKTTPSKPKPGTRIASPVSPLYLGG